MIPFRFRLQRALDVRRTQFQMAESACRQAEGRLRTIQAQQAALASAKSETRQSAVRLRVVTGRDLAPLAGWFRWTEAEAQRLTNAEKTFAQELHKRRVALTEAHRKVRLLEKLYDSRHAEWQTAFDREIEEIAADAVNSRYARLISRRIGEAD